MRQGHSRCESHKKDRKENPCGLFFSLSQFPFCFLSESFFRIGYQKPIYREQQLQIFQQLAGQFFGKEQGKVVVVRVKADVSPFQPDLFFRGPVAIARPFKAVAFHLENLLVQKSFLGSLKFGGPG